MPSRRPDAPAAPVENTPPLATPSMSVVRHPRGWALAVENVAGVRWVVRTKRKAVRDAKTAAALQHARLDIQTRAGVVQYSYQF